ncbi:hypothetical protein RYX36_031147, partial [Vicia faba]
SPSISDQIGTEHLRFTIASHRRPPSFSLCPMYTDSAYPLLHKGAARSTDVSSDCTLTIVTLSSDSFDFGLDASLISLQLPLQELKLRDSSLHVSTTVRHHHLQFETFAILFRLCDTVVAIHKSLTLFSVMQIEEILLQNMEMIEA